MTYELSKRSKDRLSGVHPDLVRVVERAIKLTDVDFKITEGRRTLARQRELLAAGATTTLNSRHLTGHAIDVAALVNGRVRWDWPLYAKIAAAFKKAAADLGVPIVWGGVWDKSLAKTGDDIEGEVASYVSRRKKAGKGAFIDGPHFELRRQEYPA